MEKKGFYWKQHPAVEDLFVTVLAEMGEKNRGIAGFEKKLKQSTSTRILDWIDHVILPATSTAMTELESLGFVKEEGERFAVYRHPGVMLPRIVLSAEHVNKQGVALRVDNIGDFLQVNGFHADIEGTPFSPYRRAEILTENSVIFMVVERRGTPTFEPIYCNDGYLKSYFTAQEMWKNLPRGIDNEETAFSQAVKTAQDLVEMLGQDLAAYMVCSGERTYWQSRNYAARVQKSRQDTLGMGWANHDHHTFRSSRRNFSKLIDLFTLLGFHKRERFYAGEEARWGAQLMENTTVGAVLFLDVDLAPEEVEIDFSTQELRDLESLNTVGLWCALHGDSILQAGMHHLAGKFLFDQLIEDVAGYGVSYMAPFSSFPYLKQAFSVAEKWRVDSKRVQRLVEKKLVTTTQADAFISSGAVGSHLENIQRREGYKGFNRKNVSAIIRGTDPRKR